MSRSTLAVLSFKGFGIELQACVLNRRIPFGILGTIDVCQSKEIVVARELGIEGKQMKSETTMVAKLL